MTKIITKSGKEYFLIELSQKDFNAPKMDEINYKNVFYTKNNGNIKIEFPPQTADRDKDDITKQLDDIIFYDETQRIVNFELARQQKLLKTQAYFFPTTEDITKVFKYWENIGQYFADKRYIVAWTTSNKNRFKTIFPTINSKSNVKIAVQIALKIMQKDYNFFIENFLFLKMVYAKNFTKGWLGFAYDIITELQSIINANGDVKTFIDRKYYDIFDC